MTGDVRTPRRRELRTRTRTRCGLLGRSRECAEGGLEGGQTAADHVGLLQAGAARGPLGVHRRTDSLQRGERVSDPGAVGGVLRDLLAQGVQRLRQIIGAPLDIGPPGRLRRRRPARPGASATLIASCRVEPFAYASTSLDRQPAAAAERRRPSARSMRSGRPGQGRPAGSRARSGWCRRRRDGAPRNRWPRLRRWRARRDAGPGRCGRGPARQGADRGVLDGAPASRRQ